MGRISDLLWLRTARHKVRARDAARHAEIRRWWAAARARASVAERLEPSSEALAALPLEREAWMALAGAAVVAAEGEVRGGDVASVEGAWSALERVWPALGIATPLDRFAAVRALLIEKRPVDAPAPKNAAETLRSIERLRGLVERAIEPRTARALAAQALFRVGVIVAVLGTVLAVAIPPLFAPTDLALGKPVRISSSHPASVAPASGEWLVNGRIERVYGVATAKEKDPWFLIDLEQPVHVGRIVVFNRGDGWFADCLPLEVSLGTDPNELHRVGLRETLFTQFAPWVLHTDETARFVRLTARTDAACALSEVEVYSR